VSGLIYITGQLYTSALARTSYL